MTSGPFAGLKLPFLIPQYNAHFIFRHLLSAILITHPHLDHIAGLIINTPLIDAQTARTAGPKRILALSGVIDALKAHIFNDVIWPNLADEDGGVGLVSYRRLVDGGDTETSTAGGGSQGYVEASEGLATKSLSLVHRSSLKENNEKGADMYVFFADNQLCIHATARRTNIETHKKDLLLMTGQSQQEAKP